MDRIEIKPGFAGYSVERDRLAEFERLVKAHDLTYSYSDAIAVWRSGQQELDAIRALAKEIPWAEAVRIWNNAVDKKISSGHREQFYWATSEPPQTKEF